MRLINGKAPLLIPPDFTHEQIRAMGKAVDCIMKHDDATGMLKLVPRNECVRPAEDMTPSVVSIADFQRKESPESLFGKFKRLTGMPDHDPSGPRAA